MVADDVTWGVRGDPGRLRRPLGSVVRLRPDRAV